MASVPQRSPFRYPGGKTWLVPRIREWIATLPRRPKIVVEPFCGGAIVGLTIAAEFPETEIVLGELDDAVAAVWTTILGSDSELLVRRILGFHVTRDNVVRELGRTPTTLCDAAFQTVLRNRVQRGGILAPGASLVKNGENGHGVSSRWYPTTLARRIRAIADMKDRIRIIRGDAFELIQPFLRRKTAAFFVDPPYTAGGKNAGRRLYAHNRVDHARLFAMLRRAAGPVMLTYADSLEVRNLVGAARFHMEPVPMKNTHHAIVQELVITNTMPFAHASPPDRQHRLFDDDVESGGRVQRRATGHVRGG